MKIQYQRQHFYKHRASLSISVKVIVTLIFSFHFFALSYAAFASDASIGFSPASVTTSNGEYFSMQVVLSSDERGNAIEGEITVPPNLSVSEIRDGDSVVNFWIERPHVADKNIITFSGISPGGLIGIDQKLFTIIFKATKPSSAGYTSLEFKKATFLKHDGRGTENTLNRERAIIQIETNGSQKPPAEKITPTDTAIPEDFIPSVSTQESVFGGKHFLVFATQDKDSGIHSYEVKEFRMPMLAALKRWRKAESPYLLRDQKLSSHIAVKATDFQDNERIVYVQPARTLMWYEKSEYWFMIIVILGLVFILSRKKMKEN